MDKKITIALVSIAAAAVVGGIALSTKDTTPGPTLGDRAVAEILLAQPAGTETVQCQKVWAYVDNKPLALKWACNDAVQPADRQAWLDSDAPADAVSVELKYRACATGICCDRTYAKGTAPAKPEAGKIVVGP